MGKYKGKYQKCRECKYVDYVGMALVFLKPECPSKNKYGSSGRKAVLKQDCEDCKEFEKKE